MTLVSQFDYTLPEELIASHPPAQRGMSRMLVVDRARGLISPRRFDELPDFLRPGDCVVVNNTRVVKARLFGLKEGGTAKIELMLVSDRGGGLWEALARPGKRLHPGTRLKLAPAAATDEERWAEVVGRTPDGGGFLVKLGEGQGRTLELFGHIPLPPYLKRQDEPMDAERYQTVYASCPGAVAAPTAGLHFSDGIFARLAARGVARAELTLHVGAGTFKPVAVEQVEAHVMHSERYLLPEATANAVNQARRAGGRCLAVGTTVARVLEARAAADGALSPGEGETDIFIHPPYRPKVVDLLLTNFHLPKSTLLMLVCAFAGRELAMAAYERAIAERFRFYSYGDCMLLL